MGRNRRAWGTIRRRHGGYYAQFTHPATGRKTTRKLQAENALEAERELLLLKEKVELEAEREEDEEHPTLQRFVAQVYGPHARLHVEASSHKTVRSHLKRLACWMVDEEADRHLYVHELRAEHAQEFVNELLQEGLKRTYVNRLLKTLRACWRVAIQKAWADENPWEGVQVKAGRRREVEWRDPNEIERVLKHVTERQRLPLTLIFDTGLRAGEALALRWDDVQLEGRPEIFVRHGKTPSSRRRVPLPERSRRMLEEMRPTEESRERIFPTRKTEVLRTALVRACAKAGARPIRTHDFRHLYASYLVQAGTAPTTVARLLGHADGGRLVMELYGRWMPDDAEAAALRRLESWKSQRQQEGRPATPETPVGGRRSDP